MPAIKELTPALAQSAYSLGAWWLHEINSMLGPSLSARLQSGRRPTLRFLINGGIALVNSGAQDESFLEQTPLSPDLLVSLRISHGVSLELPQDWVLRQRLQLPLAAASHTRDAIGFMLDRLSPFPPSQIHYATQLAAVDQKAQIAWVEVAIVPRARIEEAIARLAEQNVRPAKIEAAAPDLKQNFVFTDLAPKSSGLGSSRLTKIIALTALILLGLGSPALVLATEYRAGFLEAQVDALKHDTETTRELIAKTAKQEKALANFNTFADAPLASQALEALTRRTGDGSWLFSVEFDQKTLTLHGFAASVPALLHKISSPPFGEAEIIGSIVSGQAQGKDRFDAKLPIQAAAR